jgi:magnesium transporter
LEGRVTLEARLATELIRKHPERAALVLERLGPEEASRLLQRLAPRESAELIRRLAPQRSASALQMLPADTVADILELLSLGVASRVARRFDPARLEAVLAKAPARLARGIRSMIRFPENTAGALMDPNVMSLPEGLTTKEAFDRVREAPGDARYNIYIVDQEHKLVGAVNLRELFLAKPRTRLCDLMVRNPSALEAIADRSVVIAHPGWKEVHSLPVVDGDGCYLGAVRYRTLRQLEEQLLRRQEKDANAQQALGQLFSAGAGGLLDALTGAGEARGRRS